MKAEGQDLEILAVEISLAMKKSKELGLTTLSYILSMAVVEAMDTLKVKGGKRSVARTGL